MPPASARARSQSRPPPESLRQPRISRHALQPRQIQLARRDDLLVLEIAHDHVPDRLALRVLRDRRPAGDLVGLAGLERLAADPHVGNPGPHLRTGRAREGHAAHAHHVAALLQVRVGIEQVVADVFEDFLDALAGQIVHRALRVGDRGLVEHVLQRDRVARQHGRPPAEAGRERDLGPLHLKHRIQDQLVERAVEVAAPEEQPFRRREPLPELRFVWRAGAPDERFHLGVRREEVREDRQQAVAEVGNLAALHVEVEHAQELSVRAAVGNQRPAARVLHDRGLRHPIVRVAAQDRVDAAYARGELEVDVHAVVREQHHDLCPLRARGIALLLQFLLLDAERPVRYEVPRVGDRRIGKGLADDRDRHAVDRADRRRLEHRVAEVRRLDVLREELDRAELLLDRLLHSLLAVGELPVPGHHVDAEQPTGRDHVGALRPQGGPRALPGVPAVEEQRAGAVRAEALHQRRKVRETADLAVGARRALEIEEGERMCLARPGGDAEGL
jgi:hypothetical protein